MQLGAADIELCHIDGVEEWRLPFRSGAFVIRYPIYIWKGGGRDSYQVVSSSEFRGQLESIVIFTAP